MNFQNNDPNRQDKTPFLQSLKALAPYTISAAIALLLLLLLVIFNHEIYSLVSDHALEDFDSMTVSNGFHHIVLADGRSWNIDYEKNPDQSFSGKVRHISPIRTGKFAILSHNILVTVGDFQDPSAVFTRVSNHHFFWRSLIGTHPGGSINLLHTLPMNQTVFTQLQQIKNGDMVTIRGYEIYRIDGWASSGKYIGYWKDSGCNTILVTEVFIRK